MNSFENWNQLEQASDQEILAWAAHQSWAVEMSQCMQDPLWHAEGDVWTHTQMVCQELFQLNTWNQLGRSDQLKLLLTALLHDSGKPARTMVDPESGRIRSPKHADAGTRIARRLLMGLGCPFEFRESICHLIRFHGRPPYLDTAKSPQRELIKLSWFVDHRLLYLFALADTRGRTCAQKYSEETLELWPLIAQECDCHGEPYSFANDQARFLFFRNQLENLHYVPHEDYRCKMTVMSGLPGSGKDTWLQGSRPDLPVVSLDQIRRDLKTSPTDNQGQVVQTARDTCRDYLRNGRDFALNATNTTRQIRQLWIDVGAQYRAKIEVVYIEPEYSVLFSQNSQRTDQVPRSVIERLIDRLDPPGLTECHEFTLPSFPKT